MIYSSRANRLRTAGTTHLQFMANISTKQRLYIAITAIFCLFGIVGQGNAYGLFPNDTKTMYLDVHSGTSGTLLSSTTTPRTVLYASTDYNGTDAHICIGSTCSANPSIEKIIDTEFGNSSVDSFAPRYIASGTPLTWSKNTASERLSMIVSYVNYDISLVPEDTVSTSTIQDVNIVGGNVVINASSTVATSSYSFDIATTTLKDSTTGIFGLTTEFIGYIFGAWWPFIIGLGFIVGMAVFFFRKSNIKDYD